VAARLTALSTALESIFFVSMSIAAVYLDHHWVIDVLLGYIYFFTASVLVRWVQGRFSASGAEGPLGDAPKPPAPAPG